MRLLTMPFAGRKFMATRGGTAGWSFEYTTFDQVISTTNRLPNPTLEDTASLTPGANSTLTAEADPRTGSAGSNCLNVATASAVTSAYAIESLSGATTGRWVQFLGYARNVDSSIAARFTAFNTHQETVSVAGTSWKRIGVINPSTIAPSCRMLTSNSSAAAGKNARFDDVYAYEITPLNTHRTAPGANMQVEVDISLPATPYVGQRVTLGYRINGVLDTTSLNCFLAEIIYNDSDNWDARLTRVVNNTWTTLVTVTDIGTDLEALRVICHGSTHAMYTKHSGTWVQRGANQTDANHSTSTGVNVITSAEISVTALRGQSASPFDSGLSPERYYLLHGDSKTDETASYGEWYYLYKFFAQGATGNKFTELANLAQAGWTVGNGKVNIDADLAALDATPAPEFVLINFGANDMQGSQTEATWKANYSYIFEAIHTKWSDAKIYVMYPDRKDNGDIVTTSATLGAWLDDLIATYAYVYAGPDERVWFENGDNFATYGLVPTYVHYNTAGNVKCARVWCNTTLGTSL